VAHHAARLSKKEQCALLLFLSQCIPLATRKPIDRSIGKVSVNSNSAMALPEHIEGNGSACPDFSENFAEQHPVGRNTIQAVEHLSPNSVIVPGKFKAGNFRALGGGMKACATSKCG